GLYETRFQGARKESVKPPRRPYGSIAIRCTLRVCAETRSFSGKLPGARIRRRDSMTRICDGVVIRVETTSVPLRRRCTLIGAIRLRRGANRDTFVGSPHDPGAKSQYNAAFRVTM